MLSGDEGCGGVQQKSKGGSGKKCIWHGGGKAFRLGAQVLINALKSAAQARPQGAVHSGPWWPLTPY